MEAAKTSKRTRRLKTALAAAVCHPTRIKCLAILGERVASPAEIGRELLIDVGTIDYHVSELLDVNLVEEVGSRPARGATEHFYKAIELPSVTEDEEAEMDECARRTLAETVVALFAADATRALDTGTFLARTDNHLTRVARNVDRRGWREMAEAYAWLFETVETIHTQSAERLGKSEEKPLRVISFQGLFEAPRAENPVDQSGGTKT
ncbi:MAG: winged helix-turn-helix transcriptional regulator [Actinobacteria bacterium]|nr:winged helix-turn-helix transcriptional regulator [Actinomycetota bacterium]